MFSIHSTQQFCRPSDYPPLFSTSVMYQFIVVVFVLFHCASTIGLYGTREEFPFHSGNMSLYSTTICESNECMCYSDELQSTMSCNAINWTQDKPIPEEYTVISLRNIAMTTLKRQNMPHVNSLTLQNNDITSLSDHCFTQLTNLETLILSYKSLAVLSEHSFTGLRSLVSLTAKFHHLSSLPRNSLSHYSLPSLQMVDLSNGRISQIHALTFSQQTQLLFLNLSRNDLSDLKFLPSLKNINELDLSYNSITFLARFAIIDFRKLSVLRLSGNKMTIFDLSWLHPQNHLKFLSLSNNSLSIFKPGHTSHLRILYLDNNRLRTLDDAVVFNNSLENLYIHDNPWICDCRIKWFLTEKYVSGWNQDSAYNWT